MTDANPLLAPSTLPYELPDYRKIRAEHYLPAFDAALAEHREEVGAITRVRSVPTFENTIDALERAGSLLDRVARAFYNVAASHASEEIQEVDALLAPRMAAHHDAITLDGFLFDRVRSVYERRHDIALTPEQLYLLERRYIEMTRAGAGLDAESKRALTEINQRLSVLSTTFEKNLLADTNDLVVVFDSPTELDGLTPGEISAAARNALERGYRGKYAVSLTLYTGHPYLAVLTNRASRQRLLDASRARGQRHNDHDNRAVVREIARLRAQRAELLGYASHADFVAQGETAGSAGAVHALLRRLARPAARNAEREALARAEAMGADTPFADHDWAFATELVRAKEFDLDRTALRPWFEAGRVLIDGVFFAAASLYGIRFTERADLPAHHPDAQVFEIHNDDGTPLGLYILDLYTRDTKRGGAWMNSLVEQSTLRGTLPVVVNNLNVPQPAPGEPTLLTLDEVTTLFHEFGHALHGLFATVTYPHGAGTNVFRDFVEFPSQVNEMWILWPEVLSSYARHIDTDEPLPSHVVDMLHASESFNQGFATSEYLAAAWLDQAWHSLSAREAEEVEDVEAFASAALTDIGLNNPLIPPRYASPYFAHVFSGGYSAGYYSYIWSEVLDADTVEWFRENGGLTRANGDRFRHRLLGVGGSRDPLEAYRDFRGRDAEIAPLLARRGLSA